MEAILNFICNHAHDAYWIIFLLLMLAGMNIPISEDLILLTAGALASTCLHEGIFHLYFWVYLGCWMSAWEGYWLGRLFGPKLYAIPWFRRFITPNRIEKLHHYYERYGILTFIVGRFIPGGVRNALFMTSGLGKMPFLTFIARDSFACLLSSAALFTLGYKFGENYEALIATFKEYNLIFGGILLLAITIGLIYLYKHSYHPETSGK